MARTLAEIEKEEILEAILKTGSIHKASIRLGVSRMTLYRKLKRYRIKLKVDQILGELRRQQSLGL